MPTVRISTMNSQEFIEIKAALGLNRNQLAAAIERHGSSVTGYENGKPIPESVVLKLQQLIQQERQRLLDYYTTESFNADARMRLLAGNINGMVVAQNLFKPPVPHRTEGRLMGRQKRKPGDTNLYPKYRIPREEYVIYLTALSRWKEHVGKLARQYTDAARQRDYHLEVADINALAANAPRHAPYDILIERCQWKTVSRALSHLSATDPQFHATARALRQHWLKHRGSGYLSHRKIP